MAGVKGRRAGSDEAGVPAARDHMGEPRSQALPGLLPCPMPFAWEENLGESVSMKKSHRFASLRAMPLSENSLIWPAAQEPRTAARSPHLAQLAKGTGSSWAQA